MNMSTERQDAMIPWRPGDVVEYVHPHEFTAQALADLVRLDDILKILSSGGTI